MRVVSYWYGPEGSPYHRMARVLEWSAQRFHGRVDVLWGPEKPANRSEAFLLKARDWSRVIATSNEPLVMLDCDTYVRASLAPAFDREYDIMVTRDPKGRLNSGVLFIRPSPAVSAFFSEWVDRTAEWCARNTPELIRFGDQDALEAMLQRAPRELSITQCPMRIWNSTQRTWHRELEKARIVHVKSDAREMLFEGRRQRNLGADKVVKEWLQLEEEMTNAIE